MPLNIGNIKKDELLRRLYFRCKKHGHNGVEHFKCFNTEKGIEEKIGFLDIEGFGMGFSSDTSVVMTYCIKEMGGKVLSNFVTPEELLSAQPDKRLLKECCDDIRKFDRLVTFYGSGYDIPMLRSRSLLFDLPFPEYRELKHTDVFHVMKHKFNLRRKSLECACRFFGIISKEHRFGFDEWRKAFQGDKRAMKHILEHNIEDVESLEHLWIKINKVARITDTSI